MPVPHKEIVGELGRKIVQDLIEAIIPCLPMETVSTILVQGSEQTLSPWTETGLLVSVPV